MAVWKIANVDHEMIVMNVWKQRAILWNLSKRTSKIIKKDSTQIIYMPNEK